MFIVGASYLSLLQAVAVRCALPYVSLVSEVAADGGAVYGVEIEVPPAHPNCFRRTVFFGRLKIRVAVLVMRRLLCRMFLSCRVSMGLL